MGGYIRDIGKKFGRTLRDIPGSPAGMFLPDEWFQDVAKGDSLGHSVRCCQIERIRLPD